MKTHNPGHPTHQALVDTVVDLLKTKKLGEITSEDVLNHSGISKGSLYHHFEDFSDLLEEGEIKRFANTIDGILNWVIEALGETDKEMFLQKLESYNRITASREFYPQRLVRVKAATHAGLGARMKTRFEIEQERLTGGLADMIQECQFRGWVSLRFQPRTLAVFIQAYSLGQIVNDYALVQVESEDWLALVNTVLREVVMGKD